MVLANHSMDPPVSVITVSTVSVGFVISVRKIQIGMARVVSVKVHTILVERAACLAGRIQYGVALLLLVSAQSDTSSSIMFARPVQLIKYGMEMLASAHPITIPSAGSVNSVPPVPPGTALLASIIVPINQSGTAQPVLASPTTS